MIRKALLGSLLLVAACGFGRSVVRYDARTLIENLDEVRYIYSLTRVATEAPRGPASVALSMPPGAKEVGLVEVRVSYAGFGADGVRTNESEFYAILGQLAGELGATHFVVLRSARETRTAMGGGWISSLTAAAVTVTP